MSRLINKKRVLSPLDIYSLNSEAFKELRTHIQLSTNEIQTPLIMAASAQQGEGKTMTISNLAIAYAKQGNEVLLIDADLRNPALDKSFNVQNHTGLSNVLAGKQRWQEGIRETEINKLSLMTAGNIIDNPTELIESKQLVALFDTLKGHYDVILIDSPPILSSTDGLVLAGLCNAVYLVVDAVKTIRKSAQKAKDKLERVNARLIGVVLNSNHSSGTAL